MDGEDDAFSSVNERSDRTYRGLQPIGKGAFLSGKPIDLANNSRSILRLLPSWVPHADGSTEFKITFKRLLKSRGSSTLTEEKAKTLSLQGSAVANLLEWLNRLKELSAVGETTQLSDEVSWRPENATAATAYLLSALRSGSSEVDAMLARDSFRELKDALAVRLRISGLKDARGELESLLEEDHREDRFQEWLEDNTWIFGESTVSLARVRTITSSDKVDGLPMSVDGFCDVIELKTPRPKVIIEDTSRRIWYWCSDTSQAIGQCVHYMNRLHNAANPYLLDHPEVRAVYPRTTLVIGRSRGWNPEMQRALRGLCHSLHNIDILTFDHLVARIDRLIAILCGDAPSNEGDATLLDPGAIAPK